MESISLFYTSSSGGHIKFLKDKRDRKNKSELRSQPWVISIVKVRENGEVRRNRIVSVLKGSIKRHGQDKEALRCQIQQKD